MYNVLDYKIQKDGIADNTQAIADLIAKIEQEGGPAFP